MHKENEVRDLPSDQPTYSAIKKYEVTDDELVCKID